MTMLSKFLMTAAAASLATAPAFAAPANPAASLSVAKTARAGTHGRNASDLAGGGGGTLIAIIGAVALIVAIVIIASNNDNPSSP